ncbi:MAG: NUDIX hydrolase [Candidatus Nanoarchaeia archaeon]|jgi:8-oxo-dGTP diphosphatase
MNYDKLIKQGKQYHFTDIRQAVDMVVLAQDKLLLIQRGYYPFGYALPGGLVNEGELIIKAAKRELTEETGLTINEITHIGIYDSKNRDPRGQVTSNAFLAIIDEPRLVKGMDDAKDAKWVNLSVVKHLVDTNINLSQKIKDELLIKGQRREEDLLAFDHAKIINDALSKLYKTNY